MKTRGFLTLGTAALGGLALMVLAGRSAGPDGAAALSESKPGTDPVSLAATGPRGAANDARLAAPHAAAGVTDTRVGSAMPGPAASAMAADVPESDPIATTAATTAPAPTASQTPSLASSRLADAAAAGADETGSITIRKDAVIGVRLDRAVTTETAHVDDRVTARVARDVLVDDRPALAAGTCVEGRVVSVERGQHPTDPVRIGISFTTISLADGRRVPLQAETIYRDSEPADDAAAATGRAGLNAFLAGAITRPSPARAQPVPIDSTRRDVRIPAGSLLTMKLTAAVLIER
jgi:hypothetical protein